MLFVMPAIFAALSFLAVIVSLSMMRSSEMYPAERPPREKGQVRAGLRYARRTPLRLRARTARPRRMAVAVLRVLQQEASALFSDFEIYVADDRQEAARVTYHKV